MALIRKKNSGKYYVVLYSDGKHHWYSTGTSDKLEAQQKHIDLERVIREKQNREKLEAFIETTAKVQIELGGLLLGAAWEQYCRLPQASDLTERTLRSKRIIWEKWLRWMGTHYSMVTLLHEVNREMTIAYGSFLMKEKLSKSTFNNHRNNLRGIFQDLFHIGRISANPWDVVSTMKGESVRYRTFTDDEITAIYNSVDNEWKTCCIVAELTGLRFKDCIHLQWENIDFDENLVVVKPAKVSRFGRSVRIPLHKRLKAELLKLPRENEYVFPDFVVAYNGSKFQRKFGVILRDLGICDTDEGIVGFHSFRHTFVSRLQDNGAADGVIQELVGHGSPQMTNHYKHGLEQAKNAIAGLK